jgi:hypothetical protein
VAGEGHGGGEPEQAAADHRDVAGGVDGFHEG